MRLAREELLRHAAGRPSAITVGVFDGVHLGHQHLIGQLRQQAGDRGLAAVVVTLHPAPIQVLRPQIRIAYLTSLEERIELLLATGVESVAPVALTGRRTALWALG